MTVPQNRTGGVVAVDMSRGKGQGVERDGQGRWRLLKPSPSGRERGEGTSEHLGARVQIKARTIPPIPSPRLRRKPKPPSPRGEEIGACLVRRKSFFSVDDLLPRFRSLHPRLDCPVDRRPSDTPSIPPIQSTAPQNPALSDTWTNGVSIVPTADGKTYRMYYAGNKGEGIGFAEAAVDDPLTWREHPGEPVLRPRTDNWEGNLINQPRVVAVTANHWRMYYTGWGFQGPGQRRGQQGLAESFDSGTTWKRCGDQPILDRGDASSPDGAGACVPMVLRVKDRWMIWYTAGQISDKGHQNIHICLATSTDGIRWEKHAGNPVLTDDFTDGVPRSVTSRCYVRLDNGVFRMWYSFAKPDYRIHYAESLDGIEWERAPIAPVLGPSPGPAPVPGDGTIRWSSIRRCRSSMASTGSGSAETGTDRWATHRACRTRA